MGHRKTPSLHIRFDGFETLDQIEAWANRRGEKIIPWSRQALVEQARKESIDDFLRRTTQGSMLETLILLREMAGAEASARARQRVHDYMEEIKHDAAKTMS